MRFSWPVRFTLWPSPYTSTRAHGALYREELGGKALVQTQQEAGQVLSGTPEGRVPTQGISGTADQF